MAEQAAAEAGPDVDRRTPGVRVVPPGGLDSDTLQTPGLHRAAAVGARTGAVGLWAGTVTVEPAARTHVPPYVPHQEINASPDEPLHCAVVRTGQEPVVVALDVVGVPHPLEVAWADPLHPAPDGG